jgi:hypothetical protein
VAAVYAKARAGTLKTTDTRGKPRRTPLGPRFNRKGQVEVEVHYKTTAPIAALLALGASIEVDVPAVSTVEIFIPPGEIGRAARLPGVSRIALPHYTFSNGVGSVAQMQGSSVDAHAKQVMHVDELRHAIKASGKGAKVLVISDGIDHIADAAKAGVLPKADSVWIDPHTPGSGDEGTAALEVVHAIAPDAALGFCGPRTAVEIVACLTDEIGPFNAGIIASDAGHVGDDAYHGSGVAFTGVQKFLQAHPDIVYFTSAGNSANKFFQGTYTPSTSPQTIGNRTYRSVEDWGMATGKTSDTGNTFALPAGDTTFFELQWKDNWNNPTEKYRLYLVDDSGKILASATPQNIPDQSVQFTNSSHIAQSVNIVVACASHICDKPFFIEGSGATLFRIEYNTANGSTNPKGTIIGVYTIGAVRAATPDKIEPFSSRGPALSDGSIQPAFVAPDCVAYVSFGSFNDSCFGGTSAAVPQAAGVLALLESSPLPGGVQALINGAVDLGKKGQDNTYGYGRIDAKAAEASLDTPPAVDPIAAFTVAAGKSHKGKLKGALSATAKQAKLALRYVIVKKPAHGTVNLDAKSGAYTYTAASGYSGSDQFTYASSDGLTQSKQQMAAVTVKPASATPPKKNPDSSHGDGGGSSGPLDLLGLLLLGIPVLIRRCHAFTHERA